MVTLKRIDTSNIWKVAKLTVNQEQEDFVATNTESILEAFANNAEGNVALPFALYADDTLVGFVMFGYGSTGDEDEPAVAEDSYCLWRFMIDKAFQGKGYGRAGLAAALEYIRTRPCGPSGRCWLSYEPENTAAKALYASFGFVENGEMCGDEIVAVLQLD